MRSRGRVGAGLYLDGECDDGVAVPDEGRPFAADTVVAGDANAAPGDIHRRIATGEPIQRIQPGGPPHFDAPRMHIRYDLRRRVRRLSGRRRVSTAAFTLSAALREVGVAYNGGVIPAQFRRHSMSRFDTTRWSLVLGARGDAPHAREALDLLCRIYRPACVAFVRSRGYGPDAAEEAVQSFFLRFLDQAWHAGADRERGRFRSYLLIMLKRHLSGSAVEANALKRGGGAQIESFDEESDLRADPRTPESAFERAWALAVITRAHARLRSEAEQAGKTPLFNALSPFLIERPDAADYARVSDQLGLRSNTLAVAVHRMRDRFRRLVEDELSETTSNKADLDVEFAELRQALGLGAKAQR
jgi:DNA-directed RNA polymerase specialized sigma24 family protein